MTLSMKNIFDDVPLVDAPVTDRKPLTMKNIFDDMPGEIEPVGSEFDWDTEAPAMWEREGEDNAFSEYLAESVSEWSDAMKLGYQESITGMINRGQLPDEELKQKRMSAMATYFHTLGQGFDIPYYLAGGAMGAFTSGGNPAMAAAGGLALPAGIKQMYIDKLRGGEVKSLSEFGQRLGSAMKETTKAWLTGAMANTAGAAVAKTKAVAARVPVEIMSMVGVSSALEGKLPTMDDFSHATATMLGFHTVGAVMRQPRQLTEKAIVKSLIKRQKLDMNNVQDRLMDHYLKTGELPGEAVLRAQKDQILAQEIFSLRDKNKAFTTIKEGVVSEKQLKADSKRTVGESFKEVVAATVNDLHFLNKYTEKIVGGKKNARMLDVIHNPAKLAQLSRGLAGKMLHYHKHGGFDVKTLERNSRGMQEILKDVGKIKPTNTTKTVREEFRDYAIAKHTKELEARGEKTGFEASDKTFTKALDSKYEKLLLDLVDLQNSALKQLLDVDVINQKAFNTMVHQDKYHLPLQRYKKGEGSTYELSAGLQVKTPIKERTGGKEKIYDPIESIELDIMSKLQAVENQRIAQSIVELSKAFDFGGDLITQSKKGKQMTTKELAEMLESKDGSGFFSEDVGKITVFEKGLRTEYTIDAEVAQLIKTVGIQHIGVMTKILSPFAAGLRGGATLLADFALKNIIRDGVMSYVTTKNSQWIPRFGYDIVKQMFTTTKHTEMYKEFLKAGGANSTLVSIDRPTIRKEVMKDISRSKFHNTVAKLTPLKAMRMFSEHMELATRMAEFKLTKKRMEKSGKTGYRAEAQAAFEAREITLDFARTGSKTKAMNRTIAFFNATIQGHSKIFRALTESKAGAMKLGLAVVAPSILIAMNNAGDEDIKNIPKVQRDLFWCFKVPGTDAIMRIPKPHETGMAGSIVERGMEYILDNDPHAFDDFGESLVGVLTPNIIPTGILPALEGATNWNFFRDRNLVSISNEGKLAEYQYNSHTTELAKTISKFIGAVPGSHQMRDELRSPISVENFITAWSGGLGKHTLRLLDLALRKSGSYGELPVKPTKHWTEWPMVQSFFVRHPSMSAESIKVFYENVAFSDKIARTISGLERELKYDDIPQLLLQSDFNTLKSYKGFMTDQSKIRDTILNVKELDGMTGDVLADWKRENLNIIIQSQIAVATAGNKVFEEVQRFQKTNPEIQELRRQFE